METNLKLENLRVHYRMASLDIGDCDPDPEAMFNKWFHEAVNGQCDEPNAFVLSTVSDKRPRARVLLLKGIHDRKFIFYTNYLSAKGQEVENNPFIAMTFLWLPLQRQVRIEGIIEKADTTLSDDYFNKRPRGNQLGAIASPQSQKVKSRDELENLFKEADKKLITEDAIQRPANWGGYAVTPTYFEFWQGRDNRMHDRMVYEKGVEGWSLGRLAP